MHTVQLLLKPNMYEKYEINRRFHALSHIHNVCVKHIRKLIIQLDHNTEYTKARTEYIKLKKKNNISKEEKTKIKELSLIMKSIRKEIGLTQYDLETYIKKSAKRYNKLISSQQVQAEIKRIWRAADKYLFGNGKTIHFKTFYDFDTIGGKSNLNGAKFNFETMFLSWIGLNLKCYLPKNKKSQDYIKESLHGKISYCEVKRMMFNQGWRYYLIIILDGDSPKAKMKPGNSIMGIDPGTSTIAGVSDTNCFLENLSPDTNKYDKKIAKIQISMDRSKHATNPNKYNENGTYKKGNHEKWILSNKYRKNRRLYKTLNRKKHYYILTSHRTLCNKLLKDSNIFIVEHMDYQALQKKAKETKRQDKESVILDKNGNKKTIYKYKKKKRFGKSLNKHAPGLFLNELKRKALLIGGVYLEIDTWAFKASQYDHFSDKCIKIPLEQRYKYIGNDKIQRDLYSAFLIKNTNKELNFADREKCIETFNNFRIKHDELIKEMKENRISNKNCFNF